jgi:hypothetical protein
MSQLKRCFCSKSNAAAAASRDVKLGDTVATVGFPNIGLQGFSPKLAKGEIASLSGLRRAVVF